MKQAVNFAQKWLSWPEALRSRYCACSKSGSFSRNLWIVQIILTVAMFACEETPPKAPTCEELYELRHKCARWLLGSRQQFLSRCKAQRKGREFKDRLRCTAFWDCPRFRACIQAAADKARRRKRKARLKKAWASIKRHITLYGTGFGPAKMFCATSKGELEGEMKKFCDEVHPRAYDALHRRLVAKRDKGLPIRKDYRCATLRLWAKEAGGERIQRARVLCAELKALSSFQQVEKSVSKHRGKLTAASLPKGCGAKDIKKVQAIGTPFAKKLADKLIDLCYRKLAVAILAKQVPGQRRCKVKDVYQAVLEVGARSPELDKLMREAGKRCKK